MLCVDANVLVYAHRRDVREHAPYAAWLERARRASEPLGVPTLSLAAFLRLVTNPRVFPDPTPLEEALRFADALRSSPNHVAIEPGPRHWTIFRELSVAADARGNLVPDAYLAAVAIEHGALMCSADRDFARFPGLRWRHPLDDGPPSGGR